MRIANMGLIGCGGIARHSHLPTVEELSRRRALRLVAVCDIVEQSAREIGEKYNVPYYTDPDKMLEREKEVDFVDICTGDFTHHSLGKMAAESGKHVIVEKPMAVTLPCCDVMIDACRKAGVHFEVAENYFRMPTDRLIKRLIQSGVMGDVMRVYMVDPAGPSLPTHSGLCIDMGVHRMSQLRTYAGSEPRRVVGVTKRFVPGEGKEEEVAKAGRTFEDWGHAIVDFENGSVGIFECSAVGEKAGYRQVVGTKGTFRDNVWGGGLSLRASVGGKMADVPIDRKTKEIDGKDVLQSMVVKTEPETIWENPFKGYVLDDWRVGIAEELMSIANAAVSGADPEYGIGGRRDVEMCVALYESSLKGMAPVNLPITSITSYEQMVHEAYEGVFGHSPTEA